MICCANGTGEKYVLNVVHNPATAFMNVVHTTGEYDAQGLHDPPDRRAARELAVARSGRLR